MRHVCLVLFVVVLLVVLVAQVAAQTSDCATCDVNSDGVVDIRDVNVIVDYLAAVVTPTPTSESTAPPAPPVAPTATATVAPVTYFETLPPGTALPSGADCAALVRGAPEVRPANEAANNYIPVAGTDYSLHDWGGVSAEANALLDRVDGAFTGTTDEILQWAACKWGMEEDILKAMAVKESNWRQSTIGDNGHSFGILQLKNTTFTVTHPASQLSSAFNADYAGARWRACYEGWITYMGHRNPTYAPGDVWGCVGAWYTGQYLRGDEAAYVNEVQGHYQNKPWRGW